MKARWMLAWRGGTWCDVSCRPSGHGVLLVELGPAPLAAVQDGAQVLHGIPHVLEAQVERGEAEAQDVLVRPLAAIALAEVADHAARDQRLHDGIGAAALAVHALALVARQAHLRAAPRMLPGRRQAQAVACAALFHQADEQVRQRQRFRAQRLHSAQRLRGGEHVQPALQCREADDGLGAAQVTGDAGGWLVFRRERERRCVAPPARQRLPETVGMARMYPDERRGARAAIEVFVAAADREVRTRGAQVHRHRAGAVREVPHAEDALRMRRGGDGRHVVHRARAVIDVREHQHRHVAGERGRNLFGLRQHQFQAALAAQAFGDVEIGGKVAALAHDAAARGRILAGHVQRGAQHLVEVDGGAVRADDFAGPGADQRRELVAQALRQVEPAGAVPRADQVGAPFLRHHLGDARGGGLRQHAQGVAIQVDHPVGQLEMAAQGAQRVVRIQGAAVVECGHGEGQGRIGSG